LTRNSQCQEGSLISSAPTTGPTAGARIAGTLVVATTRPIRPGPAACPSTVIPDGTSNPPATPCSTRNAMSQPMPGASAQRAEVPVNAASDHSHSRPAPTRLLIQPQTGSAAASASR
jgi:hypothetical protein